MCTFRFEILRGLAKLAVVWIVLAGLRPRGWLPAGWRWWWGTRPTSTRRRCGNPGNDAAGIAAALGNLDYERRFRR